MTRKIITVLMIMSLCICALAGCGSGSDDDRDSKKSTKTKSDSNSDQDKDGSKKSSKKDNLYVVTINGVDYDLSGECRDVVSKMVNDGLVVRSYKSRGFIGREGYSADDDEKEEMQKLVDEKKVPTVYFYPPSYRLPDSVQNTIYEVYPSEGSFKTIHGITESSTFADIENHKDLVPYFGLKNRYDGAICIYFDGQKVDIDSYEDRISEVFSVDHTDVLSENLYIGAGKDAYIVYTEGHSQDTRDTEKYVAMASVAVMDGAKKIQAGDISEVLIINYGMWNDTDGERCGVQYYIMNKDAMMSLTRE